MLNFDVPRRIVSWSDAGTIPTFQEQDRRRRKTPIRHHSVLPSSIICKSEPLLLLHPLSSSSISTLPKGGMSSLSLPLLKVLSILLPTYVFLRKLVFPPRLSKGIPLPGPPRLPIIGNALQFPTTNPWKQLQTWSDEYGPIYQISALGKTFVVLGSEEVTNQLLRARGGIYSDRHYIAVLREQIQFHIFGYGGE
jgi:Cytochrome P450